MMNGCCGIGVGRSQKGITAPILVLAGRGRVSLGMLGGRYFQRDIQFSRLQLHSVPEKLLFLQLWPTHLACLSGSELVKSSTWNLKASRYLH